MMAGAAAGLAVDTILYPLDTIKTRLQSRHGFAKAGGFSKIYAGIGSVMVGSAPGSSLFFATYELLKAKTDRFFPHPSISHAIAASFGEIVACCW